MCESKSLYVATCDQSLENEMFMCNVAIIGGVSEQANVNDSPDFAKPFAGFDSTKIVLAGSPPRSKSLETAPKRWTKVKMSDFSEIWPPGCKEQDASNVPFGSSLALSRALWPPTAWWPSPFGATVPIFDSVSFSTSSVVGFFAGGFPGMFAGLNSATFKFDPVAKDSAKLGKQVS